MKKIIENSKEYLEDKLRELCGKITPEKRVFVIAVLFTVFAIADLYIVFQAIYNIGRDKEREHIIKLSEQQTTDPRDTLQNPSDQQLKEYLDQFNPKDYDDTERKK